jgi:hypothetical protein
MHPVDAAEGLGRSIGAPVGVAAAGRHDDSRKGSKRNMPL